MQFLSFGQRIDPLNGLVESWLTHGALDWIKQQDWLDKKVLQYGSGLGDLWLSQRVKYLISVERNHDWAIKLQDGINKYNIINYELHYRPCNDNENSSDYYIQPPISYNLGKFEPDIIIVDDAYRLECIKHWVKNEYNIILIVDNYMQSFVFLNTEARDILIKHEHIIFEQDNHQDHDGINKWKTGIFFINNRK